MLNLFNKNTSINKKMPDDYKHLLNQQAYEAMLDTILQYFSEKGEPVLKVEEGYIVTKPTEGEGMESRYGLDNLVRLVAAAKKEDREAVIYNHFNKANYDMRPLEYFKTDYETAKQHLKILVKPDDILKQKGTEDVVYKTVFPGTVSVLVFDYDDKFTYLYHHLVKEWGKTMDELFEEALFNIGNEEITVIGLNLLAPEEEADPEKSGSIEPEDQDAFVFMNPDFGAPSVCLMETKAPWTIGSCGSIVAIPSKGFGVVTPINSAEILDKLALLAVIVTRFFNEQPGNITTDFYWYYQNEFHILPETPSTEKEGYMSISLPKALIKLLKEQ